MSDWYQEGKDHIWYPYTQMKTATDPIKVVKTDGCKIILEDGSELVDGISSWWSTCHGYNHPHINAKVKEQLDKMPHIMFAGTAHEQAFRLSSRLAKLTGLDKVFFTDSGSTAVETAMKIAVQYWSNKKQKNRNKFISFSNGYHGDTMGCMSLCDPHKGMHKTFNNYMPKQYSVDIPLGEYDFEEFDEMLDGIKNTVAGLIIEPLVQGAGGLRFHSPDILEEIYRITKKHDILFIADEVMTGFGRTGNMFACNEAGITPDIMCIGKSLTGGTMTLAATICNNQIFDEFLSDELEHALMSGPTFMANPLACAAANASLDLFEKENQLEKIEKIESQLVEQLKDLKSHEKVNDVRVKGAIGVVELKDTNWNEMFELRQKLINKGVWLRPFGNIIYIMPAYIISGAELAKLTSAIKEVL